VTSSWACADAQIRSDSANDRLIALTHVRGNRLSNKC
jgi:hypothetical protein